MTLKADADETGRVVSVLEAEEPPALDHRYTYITTRPRRSMSSRASTSCTWRTASSRVLPGRSSSFQRASGTIQVGDFPSRKLNCYSPRDDRIFRSLAAAVVEMTSMTSDWTRSPARMQWKLSGRPDATCSACSICGRANRRGTTA